MKKTVFFVSLLLLFITTLSAQTGIYRKATYGSQSAETLLTLIFSEDATQKDFLAVDINGLQAIYSAHLNSLFPGRSMQYIYDHTEVMDAPDNLLETHDVGYVDANGRAMFGSRLSGGLYRNEQVLVCDGIIYASTACGNPLRPKNRMTTMRRDREYEQEEETDFAPPTRPRKPVQRTTHYENNNYYETAYREEPREQVVVIKQKRDWMDWVNMTANVGTFGATLWTGINTQNIYNKISGWNFNNRGYGYYPRTRNRYPYGQQGPTIYDRNRSDGPLPDNYYNNGGGRTNPRSYDNSRRIGMTASNNSYRSGNYSSNTSNDGTWRGPGYGWYE